MELTTRVRIVVGSILGTCVGVFALWLLSQPTATAATSAQSYLSGEKVTIDANLAISYPVSYMDDAKTISSAAEICLVRHGASKVPTGEGGYGYPDASGKAYTACRQQIDAADTFAKSARVGEVDRAVRLRILAMRACLGVDELSRTALASARGAGKSASVCAASANVSVGP